MSQSVQKSAGPVLLTGVVMTAGPAGWLVLGAAVAGVAVVQRRSALGRLVALEAAEAAGANAETAGATPAGGRTRTGIDPAPVS